MKSNAFAKQYSWKLWSKINDIWCLYKKQQYNIHGCLNCRYGISLRLLNSLLHSPHSGDTELYTHGEILYLPVPMYYSPIAHVVNPRDTAAWQIRPNLEPDCWVAVSILTIFFERQVALFHLFPTTLLQVSLGRSYFLLIPQSWS